MPPPDGGAPPAPPPEPPPPVIPSDGTLKERLPPEKIKNPFERQAAMIVQTAEAWAERLANNLGEHPADYTEAPPATVQEMFHFSPFGTDAPMTFWRKYDEYLQLAMQNHDPEPYTVAERGALKDVYPYRAELALLDALGPEQRVQRAEMLQRISHQETAKGNTPSALPSIVSPAALPPPKPAEGGGY